MQNVRYFNSKHGNIIFRDTLAIFYANCKNICSIFEVVSRNFRS